MKEDSQGDSPVGEGILNRVTGRLKYVEDLVLPGMLHGKFVRLPCAHARIRSIEVAKARRLPGIHSIFTAADFTGNVPKFGPLAADQPLLANGETKFAGEPVAIVFAESEDAALEGVSGINVDYEELPAILDFEDALSQKLGLIHAESARPGSEWKKTNIMGEWHYEWGHVDGHSADCHFTLENTYRAPFVHHFALERYSVVAQTENGVLTLFAAIQHPFVLRRIIANMLGMPLARVRIISGDIGGGFGGKGYPKIEPVAAYFASHLKRPLKITLSAEECFHLAQREAARIHIRSGFDRQGVLQFQDVRADFLVGAYSDISPRVVSKAGLLGAGPYACSNARIRSRGLFSHTPPTTAFRGFGSTHFSWAVESQMDEAAKKLGMDPVEIRAMNLPKKGDILIPGDTPVDGDWGAALSRAAQSIGWHSPKTHGRGRGIAIGIKSSVPATVSKAHVRLSSDGSATVYVGCTELGQGSRAVMANLAAGCLSINPDKITVMTGDTALVPIDTVTASSRSTVMMGNAVLAACEQVKKQIRNIAGTLFDMDPACIRVAAGGVERASEFLSYEEILERRFGKYLGEISGEGMYQGERDSHHPLGGPSAFWEVIVTAVELQVDRETGEITIHKMTTVSDVGKCINPKRAAGQDEGGSIMGLGAATLEGLYYSESGRLLNAGALDYKIPTSADIPLETETLFQENMDGPGPRGSKGLGESGILAVAPAICNAIRDCVGIRFAELPITAEKIWKHLVGEASP